MHRSQVQTKNLGYRYMKYEKGGGCYLVVWSLIHIRRKYWMPTISVSKVWKNVEPHSSTILEDEMLNSFLLERA